jgi:hypothetical protein
MERIAEEGLQSLAQCDALSQVEWEPLLFRWSISLLDLAAVFYFCAQTCPHQMFWELSLYLPHV